MPSTQASATRTRRDLLERHGLAAKILTALNADLSRRGLLLLQGTMVDATISALARPGAERRAVEHAVCAGESVDGAATCVGADRVITPRRDIVIDVPKLFSFRR